jgi:hypothetical protein
VCVCVWVIVVSSTSSQGYLYEDCWVKIWVAYLSGGKKLLRTGICWVGERKKKKKLSRIHLYHVVVSY